MSQVSFQHNPQAFRYEAILGGEIAAQIDYTKQNDVISINHTSTPPQFRGQGLAGRLTKFALDDIRDSGGRVLARCSYADAYIAAHPEYQTLLADR